MKTFLLSFTNADGVAQTRTQKKRGGPFLFRIVEQQNKFCNLRKKTINHTVAVD